ncbi:enoyl-CoA hydratase/isomerase family protein [Myxococcota bacterium]|nr:enoyl-CoA hydratase/isomerase family protein [Myxococcota bacterium]
MSRLSEYQHRYEVARLERSDDGVLEVTLHTRGGSLLLDETTHRELPLLFSDIGNDADTKVILLTGTGDDFCSELAGGDWDFSTPAGWDRTYWEGRRLMQNLMDIHVPMLAAINGPARVHAEIPILCDIVLASETTEFQDIAHFGEGFKVTPGDGSHLVWPLLLGLNRGKYFLLTEQVIDARQALDLGLVNEVLPPEELLPRARALASDLATRSSVTLRYTRVALNMLLRNLMQDGMSHGLALEGYSVMERAQQGS